MLAKLQWCYGGLHLDGCDLKANYHGHTEGKMTSLWQTIVLEMPCHMFEYTRDNEEELDPS
jgi:hypothetical protein